MRFSQRQSAFQRRKGRRDIASRLVGERLQHEQLDRAPQHFTNLHMGLMTARRILARRGGHNKQVFIITDGQPTAYYDGDELHVELPYNMLGISPNACKATLAEVKKVTAKGMNIETFMLDDNPVLVEFTRTLTRMNGGRAVMCVPGELGQLVLIEEIKRRGGRI